MNLKSKHEFRVDVYDRRISILKSKVNPLTNVTFLPYAASAFFIAGSNCSQFSHHVAQNSMTAGPFATFARSTVLPSRVCRVAAGATLPRGRPESCARAADGAASANAPANDKTAKRLRADTII